MSLMGTLGKVAMGVIVAKGVGKMMGGSRGGGGLGGLLGSLTGGGSSSANQSSGGGLGDLLGGLSGKSGGGGLGGILDSLGGGSQSGGKSSGGFGDLFNNALQGNDVSANDDQEKQAEILLRAMINGAKADGKLDEDEKKKIVGHLGDISDDEARFVQQELAAPLDVKAFINDVPRGMEEQVYMMSLFAIDLDSNDEAHYLSELAKGLNISHEVCNQINAKMGAPAIFA